METLKELNEQLSKGILPDSLYFGKREAQTTDWAKIQFNTFYKDPDYFIGKFHKGIDKILPPEFFEKMAEKAMSPADEMDFRKAQSIEVNDIVTEIKEIDLK
jgi:hypothetical protein